jgi:hypothetical protein
VTWLERVVALKWVNALEGVSYLGTFCVKGGRDEMRLTLVCTRGSFSSWGY